MAEILQFPRNEEAEARNKRREIAKHVLSMAIKEIETGEVEEVIVFTKRKGQYPLYAFKADPMTANECGHLLIDWARNHCFGSETIPEPQGPEPTDAS